MKFLGAGSVAAAAVFLLERWTAFELFSGGAPAGLYARTLGTFILGAVIVPAAAGLNVGLVAGAGVGASGQVVVGGPIDGKQFGDRGLKRRQRHSRAPICHPSRPPWVMSWRATQAISGTATT